MNTPLNARNYMKTDTLPLLNLWRQQLLYYFEITEINLKLNLESMINKNMKGRYFIFFNRHQVSTWRIITVYRLYLLTTNISSQLKCWELYSAIFGDDTRNIPLWSTVWYITKVGSQKFWLPTLVLHQTDQWVHTKLATVFATLLQIMPLSTPFGQYLIYT